MPITVPPIKYPNSGSIADRRALLEALYFQTLVRVHYEDRDGVRSVRYVVPNTIERNKQTGEPFVRVYDAQRKASRTFVLDRITHVTSEF